VSTRAATVDIELADTPTRGVTIADPPQAGGARRSGDRKANALIGVDVDPAVFFDRFIERVGPFARRLG
jgi:purine nucleosidase